MNVRTNVSKAVSNLRILDMLLTKHYVMDTITYWTIKCAKGHTLCERYQKVIHLEWCDSKRSSCLLCDS